MPLKPSIRFEDLGLNIPLPHVLSASKEDRKKEKHELKKERTARIKQAAEQLSHEKSLVERHKDFTQKEATKMKSEKMKRRKELKDMQNALRVEREVGEKNEKQKAIVAQKGYLSQLANDRMAEEACQREVQKKIDDEQSKLVKVTPKNVHVHVKRNPEIEDLRKQLPVLREEQCIVEAINNSLRTCVLICGETGSGKTTQIPQFLWECGYGHEKGSSFGREGVILVTEPRRVAAVSMAKRVAEELNAPFGEDVCYHVRYDNNLSDNCKLKFATEGIVLKEIQSDFLLKKYSVVVVDEAHERSVAGDILIGLLSRIVPLRNDMYQEELQKVKGIPEKTKIKPLKLVIMSATMRVADFKENQRLFPITPPLINVESRRFPVTNHFSKRTELRAYVDEAFRKVCQIHKKLPPGGVLLFLPTQYEIETLCQRLRSHYAKVKIEYNDQCYTKHFLLRQSPDPNDSDSDENKSTLSLEGKDEFGLKDDDYALEETKEKPALSSMGKRPRSTRYVSTKEGEEEEERMEESEEDGAEEEDEINGEYDTLHVLPLYALMDFQKQQEVFKDPPHGKRLCVIATNVAETSITIPNIRYVVDTGRVKTKVIDESTGASCFRVEWTSQASAEQRSGRAGRVGPGHCYRLYSTAVFSNLMSKHSSPEILRTSLESVVLLMKHLGIDHVGSFPFPSSPREEELRKALEHLTRILAVSSTGDHRITNMGKRIIAYPIPPRFSRVIIEALDRKVPDSVLLMITYIAAIFSTTTNVFTGDGNRMKWHVKDSSGNGDERPSRVHSLLHHGSDLLTCLKAFGVYLKNSSISNCYRYCLVQKSLFEARQLSEQLRVLSRQDTAVEQVEDTLDNEDYGRTAGEQVYGKDGELVLSREYEILIRKLFIYGFVDQVARRATVQECRYHGVEYKDNKATKAPYLILGCPMIVYIHPTSSISRTFPPPEFVTFAFLQKTVRSETKSPATMMLGLTIVTKEWLQECGVVIE